MQNKKKLPYNENDFEFLIIVIKNKNDGIIGIYLIPMINLIEKGYIHNENNKGIIDVSLYPPITKHKRKNYRSSWMNDYWFGFDDFSREDFINIFNE